MDFVKGALIGMIAGTCIGVMNNDMFYDALKIGKKEFKKMKRKLSF